MTATSDPNHDEVEPESVLDPQVVDYVAAATRGILGMAPFAGSLIAELVGIVIPNQREDRIAKYAVELEHRLSTLEQDFVKSQLLNENFTDLMEEGLRQAARSLSDDRREYIASLITHSLASEHIEFQEAKHLLRMLSEINDIEVIWLRYHLVETMGGDEVFRNTHRELLDDVRVYVGSSQETVDKAALQESYSQHLAQLNLLSPIYKTDIKTDLLEMKRGMMEIRGYRLTDLGRLLLSVIGLTSETSLP